VLHLLVDTSVWLDLAKRRDGQKLIHALGQVIQDGDVELLVPDLVIEEFNRNRERIEQSMTTSVADRFKT
jgi:predicted nucleic acid-binding protein